MFQIFIALGFVTLVTAQSAQQLCATKNCNSQQSIACQYVSNSNIKCQGSVLQLDQGAIVNKHNQLRNTVALGKLSGYKPAKRMAQMQWHPQLAKMAEYNAKTCIFDHDKCRNTDIFKMSGQNLAIRRQKGGSFNVNNEIIKSIDSWFDEYKDADMSYINSYRGSSKMIGHFTAMVRDASNYIGCAATRFTDKNGWDTILLACNYASTNILGRAIYDAGNTASACKAGKSQNYAGLCNSKEQYNN